MPSLKTSSLSFALEGKHSQGFSSYYLLSHALSPSFMNGKCQGEKKREGKRGRDSWVGSSSLPTTWLTKEQDFYSTPSPCLADFASLPYPGGGILLIFHSGILNEPFSHTLTMKGCLLMYKMH